MAKGSQNRKSVWAFPALEEEIRVYIYIYVYMYTYAHTYKQIIYIYIYAYTHIIDASAYVVHNVHSLSSEV